MALCRRDFGALASSTSVVDASDPTKRLAFDTTLVAPSTIMNISPVDQTDESLSKNKAQTMTNKTINSNSNSITNIGNAAIASDAAIDATKIGTGNVTNTQLSYLNGATSNIQTQINNMGFAVDRQMVVVTTTASTMSLTWIDVPGSTVTTRNLGSNGCYRIDFNAVCQCETRDVQARLRFVIGGTAIANSEITYTGTNQNADFSNVSMSWLENNVPNGTIIKVQFMTDDSGKDIFLYTRRLIIDGVRQTAVV